MEYFREEIRGKSALVFIVSEEWAEEEDIVFEALTVDSMLTKKALSAIVIAVQSGITNELEAILEKFMGYDMAEREIYELEKLWEKGGEENGQLPE